MDKNKYSLLNAIDNFLILNIKLFPLLWLAGVSFCLVEAFTYQGFFAKHLLLDMKLYLLIIVFSGLFMTLSIISMPIEKSKLILRQLEVIKKIFVFVLPVMMIFSFVLITRLAQHRNSIVFANDHLIFPGRIILATLLIIYFLIIYALVFIFRKQILNLLNRNTLSFTLLLQKLGLLLVFVWIIAISINKDFRLFKFNVSAVLHDPFASYDKKMQNQIGPIYKYYKFVNENTPENAVILNPKQQGQWPDVSNQGYTRYFIYPRNLISEENLSVSKDKITHIFLIGGKKLHDFSNNNRWPDFYVPAKKITYYMNDDSKQQITVYKDYDPNDPEYSEYWGIIEVNTKGIWK